MPLYLNVRLLVVLRWITKCDAEQPERGTERRYLLRIQWVHMQLLCPTKPLTLASIVVTLHACLRNRALN